jgi:fused signal recognition particle receptor
LDDLENILISSDVGLETTVKIIDRLEKKVAEDKYLNTEEFNRYTQTILSLIFFLKIILKILKIFRCPRTCKTLHVIMVVGVNGVGKTTTIGKLAYQYQEKGKRVVLGAGDTFRAAAVDQLKIWADRSPKHTFYSKGMNTDPAAVAYETVQYAHKCNDMDVAIIDTAGRLHTKTQLMDELTKIKRSIDKKYEGAPHEVLLVLDATTGQNAIEQAKHFTAATDVTAIALTKLGW